MMSSDGFVTAHVCTFSRICIIQYSSGSEATKFAYQMFMFRWDLFSEKRIDKRHYRLVSMKPLQLNTAFL